MTKQEQEQEAMRDMVNIQEDRDLTYEQIAEMLDGAYDKLSRADLVDLFNRNAARHAT